MLSQLSNSDIVIIAVGLVAIWYFFIRSTPKVDPRAPVKHEQDKTLHPDMSTLREFTREEIRKYDGKEGRPIYICIANKVFDCSEAANFYGPGGSYEAFAGRDITRAAAKFSTEERYLASPSLVGLTLSELDSFKHFHNVFNGKYPMVGKLRKDLCVGSAPVSAEAGNRATVAGANAGAAATEAN